MIICLPADKEYEDHGDNDANDDICRPMRGTTTTATIMLMMMLTADDAK